MLKIKEITQKHVKIFNIDDLLEGEGSVYEIRHNLYIFIGIEKAVDNIRNGRIITIIQFICYMYLVQNKNSTNF